MKRSDFLKKLGIGIGVTIVTPKALAGMPVKRESIKPVIFKTRIISSYIKLDSVFIDDGLYCQYMNNLV